MKQFDSLTPRESQIALLVAEGIDRAIIAERLHLSKYTVRNTLQRVANKTGTTGPVELRIWAEQNGFIRTYPETKRPLTLDSDTSVKEANMVLTVGDVVLHAGVRWCVADVDIDAEGKIGVWIHHETATDEQVESCTVPEAFIRDLSTLKLIEPAVAA